MSRNEDQLGDILLKKGLISRERLDDALAEQRETKAILGSILLKRRCIKESDLLNALSEQFNIPVVSLKDRYMDWECAKGFSASLILEYHCIPIKVDNESVTIAITDPLNAWAVSKAEEAAGFRKLKLALVTGADMDEAIKRYKEQVRGRHL